MRLSRSLARLAVLALVLLALWIGAPPTLAPSSIAQATTAPQLRVVESNTNHVVLELQVPGYDSRDQRVGGQTFTVISVPTFGNTEEPGKPQLPIKGTLAGIPPGAVPTLKVVDDQSETVAPAHAIIPAAAFSVQRDIKPPFGALETIRAIRADAAAYASSQLYPAEAARVASTGDWRGQHYARVEFHPFQYNAAANQLVFHRKLRIELALTYPNGQTPQALGAPTNEGPFESILKKALPNYSSAKQWRKGTRAALAPQPQAVYTGSNWYKLGVNADGMYKVTCGMLAQAAGKSLSINNSTVQLFKNGQELAIRVGGSTWYGGCNSSDVNDYVEFYGQAPDSKYTNTNIYWLTFGKATGKRMASADATGTATTPTSFANTIHLEENHRYVTSVPQVEGADHWYWGPISGLYNISGSYTFTIPHLSADGASASVQAALTGYTTNGHHTQMSINGNSIADEIWSGNVAHTISASFPASYLIEGTNTLQVFEPNDQDPNDVVFMNNFDVTYPTSFTAVNDVLNFNQPTSGLWQFQIDGFSNNDLEAYDVTDPLNVQRFTSLTKTQVGSTYRLTIKDNITAPPAHQYIALRTATLLSPTSVVLDATSNLHATTNGADYIIISYGGFINSVTPLANFRAGQNLRVQTVDVQDVYDEFSDGVVDPKAIHDFLQFAYSNWQAPAPSYVLLVGDGHFDPKEYCTTPNYCLSVTTPPNTNFIPAYLLMVDPYKGETASDNRFVAFDPNDTLPDMAIGRLPADITADVTAMVNKIIGYEQSAPAGGWQKAMTFVADKPDPNAGDFWQQSDLVAGNPDYVPSPYVANRIYYTSPSYPDTTTTRAAIDQAINNGTLILNFVGHAANDSWGSDGGFFLKGDVANLINGQMVPVVLEMTCQSGYFIWPGVPSIAEANVTRSGAGAVASWAASGWGLASGHYLLHEGFYNGIMQQGVYQIGPATVLGKQNLYTNGGGSFLDLIDTFVLFGDPATRLVADQADVAITKQASSAGPLPVGSTLSYTINFTNNGPGRAERVVISDTLPSGLISTSWVNSGVPITPTGSVPYAWNVGALPAGGGGTITINATLDRDPSHYSSLTITNTAQITTPTLQSDTSNDSSSVTTQATIQLFLPFLIK